MTTNSKHASKASSTSTNTSASNASYIVLPPTVTVPVPPEDFDRNVTIDYRTAQPRQGELASIGGAAEEVGAFPDWVAVFGKTAPPAAHVSQAFVAVAEWATLLTATTLWFQYVRTSAAIAWQDTRGLVEALKPPFELACKADPTIGTTYPSLTRLLGNAKAIAKKGIATRKANAKETAAGKLPTHGKVGRSTKRRAEAAAYAASTSTTPPTVTAPPVTATPAPTQTTETPISVTTTPVTGSAPGHS